MPTVILMRPHVAAIASGSSTSSAVNIEDVTIVGMLAPEAVDSTKMLFDVSLDGQQWHPLRDEHGSPIQIILGPSAAVTIDYQLFRPWWYMRLASDKLATADRAYTLLVRAAW